MERRPDRGRKGGVWERNKTVVTRVVTAGTSGTPELVSGSTSAKWVSKRVSKEVNLVSLYIQRTNFQERGAFLTKACKCVFENIMSWQQKLGSGTQTGCGEKAFNIEQIGEAREGPSDFSQAASTWCTIKAGWAAMSSDSRELPECLHLWCNAVD